MDQWNRTESPEINPSLYGQLIFNKGGSSIKWRKIASSTNGLGELDSYMQKNETQPPNYTIHQKKFKMDKDLNISCDIRWIKDLNISFDIIKVLEENIGRKISDVPHNIFTDMSPRARNIKERINK